MATPAERRLARLKVIAGADAAQANVLRLRASEGGGAPAKPSTVTNLGAQAAKVARNIGQAALDTGDLAIGGPITRALAPAVGRFGQGVSDELFGATPTSNTAPGFPTPVEGRRQSNLATLKQRAQPVIDTVQPTESGAVTANELAPSAGRGVPGVARAAPRSATNGAGRFLDTVKSNRQTLLDAGGIEVIRGLAGSIDTPADSEFGHQSFSEDLFGPGGFEGDERLKNAAGSAPLAGAIETGRASDVRSAAQVNAARIAANARIATAGAVEGKGAQEGTLEARREELQRLAVSLNDLPDSPAKAAQLLQVTTAIKGLNTIAQQANNFGLANDPVQLNTQ